MKSVEERLRHISQRALSRHQLDARLKALDVYVSIMDIVYDSYDLPNAEFCVSQIRSLSKGKDPPLIFRIKNLRGRKGSQLTLKIIHSLEWFDEEFPWKLDWWYCVPGNTATGPYVLCFNYPDIFHLAKE